MARDLRDHSSSPVTARAVAIGGFASLLVLLVMAYNDYYLQNTLLIGNHFPVVSIAILMALVLGVNTLIRARRWGPGLAPAELLLVWGMIGVAGGICSAGIMRYFPSWMVSPAYYAAASGSELDTYVLKHLPSWMVVSADPADPSVRWFMEGLPSGGTIPWKRWLVPMGVWFGFALLTYASHLALISMFFQQWSVRERLIFPVVQLPVELAQSPEPGRWVNAFLRNPLTWVGVAIPGVIHGYEGLRDYFPELPQLIALQRFVWTLFPDRPWSEFHPMDVNIYFSVIGLTFMLTTEIAFSMWFFYLLYRFSFVYIAWLGSGATGYWGNWGTQVSVFQCVGAVFAIAAFLFWTARRGLSGWWKRAMQGTRDRDEDPWSPRAALLLITVGLAGQVLWLMLAQVQWWIAIAAVAIFLAIVFVLTRIVSEAGLMFVQSNVIAYDVVTKLVPAAWVKAESVVVLMMQKAVIMLDLREIFMPYVLNGMRACAQVRARPGRVLSVLAVTAVLAVVVSGYGRVVTSYKYGGVNMDQYANIAQPTGLLGEASNFQKNPPAYDWVRLGETSVLPVGVAHVISGAAGAGVLLWLRSVFAWWPLHPFGYVMCAPWAMQMFWFSLFLGWVFKASVMTFGGAQIYRKALPLFLGFVLGESAMAAFWMLVSLITGTPGHAILPH